MRIRRQDYRLSLADLMRFPAWEYALDEEHVEGQDERTVRPYLTSAPLDPQRAYFIVRASFHLADATQIVGHIKPIRLSGSRLMGTVVPADMNAVIVTENGHVVFWYRALRPDAKEISENYRLLGKRSHEMFPIGFASDVEVLECITAGIIEGFLYCDESVQDFFNLKPTDIRMVK